MRRIDLHTHTACSDGALTPTELIALAAKRDIAVIAITDHDSLEGLAEGEHAAAEYGVCLVPGIEISALYNMKELHFLGLFVDRTSSALNEAVNCWRRSRDERNRRIFENLWAVGVRLDETRLLEPGGNASAITRGHFARAIAEAGYCVSTSQAFKKYLAMGTPTYARRQVASAAEAIDVIKAAGGIPILAHPLRYKLELVQVHELVKALAADGLCGLECYYSGHSFHEQTQLIRLAEKYRLSVSGGSDFHGFDDIEPGTGYGKLYVPYEVYTALQQRIDVTLTLADSTR